MIGIVIRILVLSVAMVVGPVSHQVLGMAWNPWARPWRMYAVYGLDLCDVSYEQLNPDGSRLRLDRYELLGFDPWTTAPLRVRNLPDGPTIGEVGQRLCAAVGGKAPDVRARARCAAVAGWKPAMDAEHNLCRLRARGIQALEPKPRSEP